MLNPLIQELRLIDRLLFTSIYDIPTAFADVTPEQSFAELGFDIHEVYQAYQDKEAYPLTKYAFSTRIQIGDTDKTAVILTQWLDNGLKLEWASDNFKWRPMLTPSKGDVSPPEVPLFHRFCINLRDVEYKNKLGSLLKRIAGYEKFNSLDSRDARCTLYYTYLNSAIADTLPTLKANPEPLPGISEAIKETHNNYHKWSDAVLKAFQDHGRKYLWHAPSWQVFVSEVYELYPTLERPAVATFFKALANIHATGWTEVMQNLGNYHELHSYLKPVLAIWLAMFYPLNLLDYCARTKLDSKIIILRDYGASLTAEDLARTPDATIYALCSDVKLYHGLVTACNQLNRDIRPSWLVKTLIKAYQEAEEIATDAEALPGIWGLQVLNHIKTACGQFITAPPNEVTL